MKKYFPLLLSFEQRDQLLVVRVRALTQWILLRIHRYMRPFFRKAEKKLYKRVPLTSLGSDFQYVSISPGNNLNSSMLLKQGKQNEGVLQHYVIYPDALRSLVTLKEAQGRADIFQKISREMEPNYTRIRHIQFYTQQSIIFDPASSKLFHPARIHYPDNLNITVPYLQRSRKQGSRKGHSLRHGAHLSIIRNSNPNQKLILRSVTIDRWQIQRDAELTPLSPVQRLIVESTTDRASYNAFVTYSNTVNLMALSQRKRKQGSHQVHSLHHDASSIIIHHMLQHYLQDRKLAYADEPYDVYSSRLHRVSAQSARKHTRVKVDILQKINRGMELNYSIIRHIQMLKQQSIVSDLNSAYTDAPHEVHASRLHQVIVHAARKPEKRSIKMSDPETTNSPVAQTYTIIHRETPYQRVIVQPPRIDFHYGQIASPDTVSQTTNVYQGEQKQEIAHMAILGSAESSSRLKGVSYKTDEYSVPDAEQIEMMPFVKMAQAYTSFSKERRMGDSTTPIDYQKVADHVYELLKRRIIRERERMEGLEKF